MTGTNGEDLLAQLIWHEGGAVSIYDVEDWKDYLLDLTAIGTAIVDEWNVADGRVAVYVNGARFCPLGSCHANLTLQQVIIKLATYKNKQGQLVSVFDQNGNMIDAKAQELQGILNESSVCCGGEWMHDPGTGNKIGTACEGVLASLSAASDLLDGAVKPVTPNGLVLLAWDQSSAADPTDPNATAGMTGWKDPRYYGETFWGVPWTPPPVRNPIGVAPGPK